MVSQAEKTSFSERIKAARKSLGLTRAQTAKKWDISIYTLRSWEEQTRKPHGLYLEKITRILARLEAKEPPKKTR